MTRMQSLANKVVRSVAMVAVIVVVGKVSAQSDSTSNKPTTYSPYSSLMYSPYSSMLSSLYSQYNPLMANSMMMPYYAGYPYSASMGSYGHSSTYHPSQYMSMAASYPHSTYAPVPYMAYTGYTPLTSSTHRSVKRIP